MTSAETPSIFDVYDALGGQTRVANRNGSVDVLCLLHLERNGSCTLTAHNNTFFCHGCGVGGSAVELVRLVQFANMPNKEGYRASYVFLEQLASGKIAMPQTTSTARAWEPKSGGTRLVDERRMQYTFVDHNGQPAYDEIRIEGYDPDILATLAHPNDPNERQEAATKDVKLRRRLPAGRWQISGDKWRYYDTGGNVVPYGPLDPAPIEKPTRYSDGTPAPEPYGRYLYTLRGIPRVFYRLPSVLATAREGGVIVPTEGPKKADAIAHRADLCGTTLAGGTLAECNPEHAIYLMGASGALILSDSDFQGRACAINRAKVLANVIPDVRIIDFFNDNSARDVMDWMASLGRVNGETLRAHLYELANSAMQVTPEGFREPSQPFPPLIPMRQMQYRKTLRGSTHR